VRVSAVQRMWSWWAVGYGTWYLREALSHEPALADAVRETLRER
jgi:hypothetical protein